MAPHLNPGNLVYVSEGEYETGEPSRGDIVAVRPAAMGGKAFVKRLVGLPHEQVQADGKQWQLREGEFFVLGDQREHSADSRIFGPVRREELLGPVRVRVWPWKRLNEER